MLAALLAALSLLLTGDALLPPLPPRLPLLLTVDALLAARLEGADVADSAESLASSSPAPEPQASQSCSDSGLPAATYSKALQTLKASLAPMGFHFCLHRRPTRASQGLTPTHPHTHTKRAAPSRTKAPSACGCHATRI